jgi:hypothetical protein
MTPTTAFEHSMPTTGHQGAHADIGMGCDIDIIGALIAALTTPETYRLSERGGELFIEPASEVRH